MGSGSARILDGPVFSNETAAVEDCTVGVARRGVAAFTQFDNDGASERTRAGIARRRSVDVDVPDSTRIPERTRVVRQDPGSRFRMEHNHWITRSNQADNPAIMDGSSVNAPGPFQAVARERMGGSVIELVGKSRTRGRGSSRASTVVYGLPRTGFVVCC